MMDVVALADIDAQFLKAFEAGSIDKAAFKHRDHVRLAWILLRAYGTAEAHERVERGIRAFATLHGVPGLFHVTITQAWMRIVSGALADDAAESATAGVETTFDDWIERHQALLDGGLLSRYFSDAALKSEAARAGWVEPDRAPLPTIGER